MAGHDYRRDEMDRLDALSRTRALTDGESYRLEKLMFHVRPDVSSEIAHLDRVNRTRSLTDAEVDRLERLIRSERDGRPARRARA